MRDIVMVAMNKLEPTFSKVKGRWKYYPPPFICIHDWTQSGLSAMAGYPPVLHISLKR